MQTHSKHCTTDTGIVHVLYKPRNPIRGEYAKVASFFASGLASGTVTSVLC